MGHLESRGMKMKDMGRPPVRFLKQRPLRRGNLDETLDGNALCDSSNLHGVLGVPIHDADRQRRNDVLVGPGRAGFRHRASDGGNQGVRPRLPYLWFAVFSACLPLALCAVLMALPARCWAFAGAVAIAQWALSWLARNLNRGGLPAFVAG